MDFTYYQWSTNYGLVNTLLSLKQRYANGEVKKGELHPFVESHMKYLIEKDHQQYQKEMAAWKPKQIELPISYIPDEGYYDSNNDEKSYDNEFEYESEADKEEYSAVIPLKTSSEIKRFPAN